MFIAAQFIIAKCWRQPRCPSENEWIKSLFHLHNGILHSRKKEGAPTLCHIMDGMVHIPTFPWSHPQIRGQKRVGWLSPYPIVLLALCVLTVMCPPAAIFPRDGGICCQEQDTPHQGGVFTRCQHAYPDNVALLVAVGCLWYPPVTPLVPCGLARLLVSIWLKT